MIRLIMEKELKDMISSTRFAITFGACSLLFLLSFYVGGRHYQITTEQYEAGLRAAARSMEAITDWSEVRDHRIALPPSPVASLVMGVTNDIGRTAAIQGRGEITPVDSRYGEDPIYAVFRFLDLDFLFQIVLSLFAILFAYDAINGEKERGTLRLTFANSIPRSTYILGKMLGSYLGLAIPLLVPLLLGCLTLILMGIPLDGGDWARVGLMVLAGYLYLGAFLAITIFVSSRTRHSSSSFLISLVVWILAVMIIPRTAVLLAGRAVEVPSLDETSSKKSRYAASLWEADRRRMAEFRAEDGTPPDQVLQEFQKFMGEIMEARQQKLDQFAARVNEERINRQRRQEALALSLARLSPAATFSLASMAIAGTGLPLQQHYALEAEAYQRSYAEFIRGKTGQNPGGGFVFRISTDEETEKEPINAAELPPFTFRGVPLAVAAGSFVPDLGILSLFAIVFFFGAFVSFLRYDLR